MSFYKTSLKSLGEPLIDRKIRLGDKSLIEGKEEGLRDALISALKNRHLLAFLIDEGHHLIYAYNRKLEMEEIKSISNLSGVPLILFGTYDLLDLLDLSGQLAFRAEEIHFPRYYSSDKDDYQDFIDALGSLQNFLPVKTMPDFVNDPNYMYFRSAGCIGILKQWLYRCLVEVLKKGEDTIDRNCLERNAYTFSKLLEITREITDGERRWKERKNGTPEKEKLLEDVLNTPPGLVQRGLVPIISPASLEENQPQNNPRSHAFGARNPSITPIGPDPSPTNS